MIGVMSAWVIKREGNWATVSSKWDVSTGRDNNARPPFVKLVVANQDIGRITGIIADVGTDAGAGDFVAGEWVDGQA